MKEELENLGIELVRLAKKYGQDYLTIDYINGNIHGNNDPCKDEFISIYLDEKEVEERCLKD